MVKGGAAHLTIMTDAANFAPSSRDRKSGFENLGLKIWVWKGFHPQSERQRASLKIMERGRMLSIPPFLYFNGHAGRGPYGSTEDANEHSADFFFWIRVVLTSDRTKISELITQVRGLAYFGKFYVYGCSTCKPSPPIFQNFFPHQSTHHLTKKKNKIPFFFLLFRQSSKRFGGKKKESIHNVKTFFHHDINYQKLDDKVMYHRIMLPLGGRISLFQ